MVSKAKHNQSLNMKMFNLGYAVGIIGILVVWNVSIIVMSLEYENPMPFIKICKGTEEEQSSIPKKSDTPIISYIAVFLTICIIYVLLISKRTYKYLDSINDNDLKNLPAKNILTFHDTKVLVLMIYLGFIVYVTITLLKYLDLISLQTMMNLVFLEKVFFGDVLFSFVHPIIIIRKTRKYLPQLWSDSTEVEGLLNQNNDFYAWLQPEPTSDNGLTPAPAIKMSERPRSIQETFPRTLNESSAPHPFAIIAPEY